MRPENILGIEGLRLLVREMADRIPRGRVASRTNEEENDAIISECIRAVAWRPWMPGGEYHDAS